MCHWFTGFRHRFYGVQNVPEPVSNEGAVMHSHMKSARGPVWLVSGVLAVLISLNVGMAGEGDTLAPAVNATHQDRNATPSSSAATLNGSGTAEGRFCRPVWSAKGDEAKESAACVPVSTNARLMSL